jgi:hypothetical protein
LSTGAHALLLLAVEGQLFGEACDIPVPSVIVIPGTGAAMLRRRHGDATHQGAERHRGPQQRDGPET